MTNALDHLAGEPRWVAWANEKRGEKFAKIPYGRDRRRAKADDPTTWMSRGEAEKQARQIAKGHGGGIGIELGDVGADQHLAGIDLDSCLDDKLAPWATAILQLVDTYAEISPSGCGMKLFFYVMTGDVRWFLDRIGVHADAWGCRRDVPGEDARDHGPAVECYLAARYFTVTGNRWPGAPDRVRTLDRDTLDRLANLVPPPRRTSPADTSRSAIAFKRGKALRRSGKTFEEMVTALRADPETAAWVGEKGEANGERELRRIWEKTERPSDAIVVRQGLRHEAADDGLAALDAAGVPFLQRDKTIVRVCMVAAKTADGAVTYTPGIDAVSHALLARALGKATRWERLDTKGNRSRIDPPRDVVEQIAHMAGEWPFPPLSGVIGTPTMRPDGSLLSAEGYDNATGLVLLGAPPMPAIPETPSRHDAEVALALLDALLDEFPFGDDGIARAVALSMLLTPVLRGAMPAVPMHLITAPQPGTGKSYIVDLASMIATSERAAVVAVAPNPDETEKRLIGAALAGFPIIALDNASSTLEGDFLCQVTERPLLQLRALGKSDMTRVANVFTSFANGNNIAVAADLVRRTICCRLDANMEDPECRTFRGNPLAAIQRNRGAYVAACLTIARAYICAGKPRPPPSLPSYEAWSDLVRAPLVWLGRADPVSSMATLRDADPERQARANLFKAWAEDLGPGGAYQTVEIIKRASEQDQFGTFLRPTLRDALLDIARDHRGTIDPKRLGRWFAKTENNRAAGHKLTSDRGDAARPRWVLLKA